MKKMLLTALTLFAVIFSFGIMTEASTLDSIDIYIKYDILDRMVNSEQSAPTSITDAGEERIDTYSGSVSYYKEEVRLPGINGLDLVVGRKFNTATDMDIWGDSQYVSVKDYRDINNPYETYVYVFPYYLNEACTGETIFVAYDSMWDMLDAESGTTSITVNTNYQSEAINLEDTTDDYNWGIDGSDNSVGAGLDLEDDIYIYGDIQGNGVTLYRDLSKKRDKLWKSDVKNPVYIEDIGYHKSILLGGGWDYDIPTNLGWDGSSSGNYDYQYGMFYDAYAKENVNFSIKYDGRDVRAARCYYTRRPITDSENPGTGTSQMYDIVADINSSGTFLYTITRIDGTEFYFEDEELLSITDRFGNEISFEYPIDHSTVITDTLGRRVVLTNTGISVEGDNVVAYSFEKYNDDVEDPNRYYDDDDSGRFTATYKINGTTTKSVVYNISQRGRKFKAGNGYVSYSKIVLDEIILPTGAKRIYDYGEMERAQYFRSSTMTDYGCISRYDLQSDSQIEENWIVYDYGEKSATPVTVTSYPDREGYEISETFDKEGCVTQRVTECVDAGYTVTEVYTYDTVDGDFRVETETVTRKSSDGTESSYTKDYAYSASTHNITKITRDDEMIYKASYGNYGLLASEYELWGTNDYRGIGNVISGGKITKKKYTTLTSPTDTSADVEETANYTYDSYGNVTSSDDGGVEVEYTYEYGDYSGEEEPEYSIIVTTMYPAVDNITNSSGVDIPDANVTMTQYYDKWGHMVKSVDGEGNATEYTYDMLGRVLSVKNPDNTTKTYRYYDNINNIYTTDERGVQELIGFDSLGREKGFYRMDPDRAIYAIVYIKKYDANSNVTEIHYYSDSSIDSKTRYTYYSDGAVKSEVTREGSSATGEILAQTDYSSDVADTNLVTVTAERRKNGTESIFVTNYTNQYGYKVKDVIGGDGAESEQVYTTDAGGNITEVYDLRGNRAHKYTYDYRGRVTVDTYPVGKTTNVYEDALLYQVKDGKDNVVKTYEYNTMGLVTRETTPVMDDVDNVTEYYYDRNGNVTRTETSTGDGTGTRTAVTMYDNRNRPVAVDDGSGYWTRYEYDNGGNIVRMATGVETVTEELNRNEHSLTEYEYSYAGYLTALTDPMGYSEYYTTSSRGVVLTSTDKKGAVTEYTYDGLYRVTEKVTGTESVEYEYDLLGNVIRMIDGSGETVYTYDKTGNILTETKGNLVKTYTYDANGNRLSANIAQGTFTQNLTYTYDENNRMTRVTDENGYTNYTYDKNNRVLTKKSHNTEESAFRTYSVNTYYDSGMLKTKKNYMAPYAASDYRIDDYTLTYYADGNMETVTTGDVVTSYVYDNAGRLTSESVDGGVVASYTYDARGNRATKTDSVSTTTYTYDKNNRLTAEDKSNSDGTTSFNWYCYNNDGTLNEKYWGAGLAMYTYSPTGKLISYSSGDTGATYTYDGNGIRLSKTVNGVTTDFITDGGLVVGEVCGSNIVKYTYGNDLTTINNNGVLGYYHTDEHGSISAISDKDRNLVASYDFDAFGNETETTADYYNPMRYCGEYADSETGLIYLRARYYDPAIGRFISEDPVKDGLNWYVYCSNNPVMFVDPLGLAPSKEEAAAMADHIYSYDKYSEYADKQVKLNDGTLTDWVLIDSEMGRESMKVGVYKKEYDDGTSFEYAVVFRGSIIKFNVETLNVWKNNVEQFMSAKSADMWDAIEFAQNFASANPEEITFVGHSKGGAEALAASVATNENAIVFNPAKPNLIDYGLTTRYYTSSAVSYVVETEILNVIFGEPGIGKVTYLEPKNKTPWYISGLEGMLMSITNSINNHMMEAVFWGLEKEGK